MLLLYDLGQIFLSIFVAKLEQLFFVDQKLELKNFVLGYSFTVDHDRVLVQIVQKTAPAVSVMVL